jgi:hypothetical protein
MVSGVWREQTQQTVLKFHEQKRKNHLLLSNLSYAFDYQIINKAIMGPSTQQIFSSSVIATCFGHMTIIKWHTVVYCLKLLA